MAQIKIKFIEYFTIPRMDMHISGYGVLCGEAICICVNVSHEELGTGLFVNKLEAEETTSYLHGT